jgi:4-hydroxybenzoate polyprenyltransferase
MLPLLGATTLAARLTERQVWGVLGVAFSFHLFCYVFNDVIDLPIDRRQPGRAGYPLVRGVVRPWQALTFALIQIPLAFALTAYLGGGAVAYAALGAAFCGGAAYDVWGKRARFPPLTDAVQGLGWASLVLYGALIAGGTPAWPTWLLASFILVYIVQLNGVHASLRDLTGDIAAGARTTAIWMGARVARDRGLVIPRWLIAYAFGLQVLLAGLIAAPLLTNDFGYSPWKQSLVLAVVLALQAGCAAATAIMLRQTEQSAIGLPVMVYIILSLIALIALFAPAMDAHLRLFVLVAFFGPLVVYDSFFKLMRWLMRYGWLCVIPNSDKGL